MYLTFEVLWNNSKTHLLIHHYRFYYATTHVFVGRTMFCNWISTYAFVCQETTTTTFHHEPNVESETSSIVTINVDPSKAAYLQNHRSMHERSTLGSQWTQKAPKDC